MNPNAEFALPPIPAERLCAAREAARRSGRRVIEELEEALGLPPREWLAALGRTFRYPVLSMDELGALEPAFDLIPYAQALEHGCLALRDREALVLVCADPFDAGVQEWAEERVAQPARWHLVHHQDLAAYLARHEEGLRAMDSVLAAGSGAAAGDATLEDLSFKTISEDTSPVVKLVHSTLYDALKTNVSDIHLETEPAGLVIKYRVDGVLTRVGSVPDIAQAEQIISRVKVMAELDIAERRIPQDGRFKVSIHGRPVDFRVSIMPSIYGEDAVLRILDKQALAGELRALRLDQLGFDADVVAALRRLATEPYGMLLVTGPTGSGKTTTLYGVISEINHGLDKIITIEEPVEYQLPGVLQIPVNEKKGLTFARGLRSILRHDPDKIMVGEIRDPETAQIAVQSALTGHLVFTTVHANNVFDVIGRFMHMGVDPYSFVSALNGILAQRLVRLNCPACAQPVVPEARLLAESGIAPEEARGFDFRAGRGCGVCRGTGFKGRRAIGELLLLTDEIRELIVAREPIRRIKEAARAGGTRFLRAAAVELVKRGASTLTEINRVTFVA